MLVQYLVSTEWSQNQAFDGISKYVQIIHGIQDSGAAVLFLATMTKQEY